MSAGKDLSAAFGKSEAPKRSQFNPKKPFTPAYSGKPGEINKRGGFFENFRSPLQKCQQLKQSPIYPFSSIGLLRYGIGSHKLSKVGVLIGEQHILVYGSLSSSLSNNNAVFQIGKGENGMEIESEIEQIFTSESLRISVARLSKKLGMIYGYVGLFTGATQKILEEFD